MSEPNVAAFIRSGVASWSLGIVLDTLLETFIALDNLDKKVGLLLKAPLESAQRYFRLAKMHADLNETSQFKSAIEKSKELFDSAASRSQGLGKIHALYLTGLCCDLLGEDTSKLFYYYETIQEIDSFVVTQEEKKGNHSRIATIAGGGAGFLIGGGTAASIGSGLLLMTTLPISGIAFAAACTSAIGANLITKKIKGNTLDKKIKALDYSLEDLRSALAVYPPP